MKTYW